MRAKEFIPNDRTLEEGWQDWVMGAGIGSIALGGGLAAYDNLTANTEADKEVPKEQPLPTKKLKPLEEILVKVAQQSGITGSELKQFLAQCAHETMDFSTLKEIGSDKYIIRKYDRKYNPSKAKVLGNTKIGDGLKYKGRGFIQLTGKYNYTKAGEALNLPLEQQPELAEKPIVAAKIAVWYWQNRVKTKVNDFTDVAKTTKPINSKLAGLDSRQAHFDKYASVSIPTVQPKKKT